MTEKDKIKWQLDWISEHASDLSQNDLAWAIRIEEAYQKQKYLSPRQQEILADIFSKC
jgi:hypothetical protein